MRTAVIVMLTALIVAGFLSRELSADIETVDTDSLSIDYLNENVQSTQSASDVMNLLGEQTLGLSLDGEPSFLPVTTDISPVTIPAADDTTISQTILMTTIYMLILFLALGVLTPWRVRKRYR
jgi:hypothetical protein